MSSRPIGRDEASGPRVPAEPGLWILVLVDLVVFAVLFGAFLVERRQNPEVFARSGEELTLAIGVANTLILLTSSLLVARFVQHHRAGEHDAAGRVALLTIGGGLLFAALKVFEWGHLLGDDLTPTTDTFFTWYYVLTGLHLVHLTIGLTALVVARRAALRRRRREGDRIVVEGVATYWHMVDLLWLVIFPLAYFTAA